MNRLLRRGAVNAVVGLSALYTVLPLLWLLLAALKNRDALSSGELFGTGDYSVLGNLSAVFTMEEGIYGRWYANSLLYAVGGALLGSMISVACGYAFDKYRFRHKEKLFGLVLAGVMVPPTVLAPAAVPDGVHRRPGEHLLGGVRAGAVQSVDRRLPAAAALLAVRTDGGEREVTGRSHVRW
ncbi:hypothetical protein GCM10023237_01590 [Streptomyces coeruleoprunus]